MIKLNNGYLMPQIGLGTFLMKDSNQIKEVIKEALRVGYRHFDTAQMYKNEKQLGDAFREVNFPREEMFITTKLQNHHSKERTKELILNSINDLQIDYLDLLLIHWPNHDDKVNLDTWRVFEELYLEGKIKAIGLSNFTRYQLEQLLPHCKIKPQVNQVEMHPGISQIQMIKYLNDHNIQTIGYGPLMRGRIYESPYKEVLEEIANRYNASIAQVTIAWGMSKGIMVIPKTSNVDRLKENFDSKNIKLSDEDIKLIDSLNTGVRLYSDPSNNVYGTLK